MHTGTQENHETRQRLLEAAGEIFAEEGFRNTTVRDICQKAGANVAAVNYHFGDKEALYAAVLQYAHGCLKLQSSHDLLTSPGASPEERLAAFIHGFLRQLFDEGKPAWRGKLVAREMVDPTSALDRIVEEEIRPRAKLLHTIIREIVGPNVAEEDVSLSSLSIVSQCVFYLHARPVLTRLKPQLTYSPENIRRVAEHITRFALTALKNWPDSRKGAAQ